MDEHEDFQSVSSSDELKFEESSVDRESTDEENLEVIEEDLEVDKEDLGVDGRGNNTQEGLGDNNGGVQLEDKNPIFRPVWKDNAGGYLRGVRESGSSTTKKRERQRKSELKKSASTIRSIVDMFSAQSKKTPFILSLAVPPSKSSKEKVKETRQELETQALQELGDLLRLITSQMN